MSSNKILVFASPIYSLKTTDGGPSGFLAQNLSGFKSDLYDLSAQDCPYPSLGQRFHKKLGKFFNLDKQKLIDAGIEKVNRFECWIRSSQEHFFDIKASNYKFIYFHDVWTLKSCLPLIRPDQIILFQPHCPELPSEEIESQKVFSPGDIEWTKEAQRDAFSRANILIFPNSYVLDIYGSLLSHASKIFYINSAARKVTHLRHFPLNEKIHLLYIGRRNKIKGFDLILEGFREAYKQRKDINLLLLGSGQETNLEGVYDIGFTDAVHQWIYNCDFVVNCNRQSYFDLSVLETLSIGTPIILTDTNGHHQLVEDGSAGIINMGPPDSTALKEVLLSSKIKKKAENLAAVTANQTLYEKKYSDSLYRKNLEQLFGKILAEYR